MRFELVTFVDNEINSKIYYQNYGKAYSNFLATIEKLKAYNDISINLYHYQGKKAYQVAIYQISPLR